MVVPIMVPSMGQIVRVGDRKIKYQIELKIIIKNMQKLPVASDRKRGDACAKKRNRPDIRKDLILFQQ